MALAASCNEGPNDAIEWHCFDYDITFEDYSLMRGFEPGHCVVSEDFYAGLHHWQLQYYPNGVDESNKGYASVFVKLPGNLRTYGLMIKARFHIIMHDVLFAYGMHNDMATPLDPSVHTFCSTNRVGGFDRFKSKSLVEEKCWNKSKDCIKLRCYIWVTKEFSDGVKRRVRSREGSEDSKDSE